MTDMKYSTKGRRSGKSLIMAEITARAIKDGKRVVLATGGKLEEIVGVPGFDDGRQIEDKRP